MCVFHSPPTLILFSAGLGDVCSARPDWMLALEASVAYSLHNICCYCSSFPACHGIWFLPKVAFVCTIVNSIIVFFGQFPRCRGSYCHAYRPVATQRLSEASILSWRPNLCFNIIIIWPFLMWWEWNYAWMQLNWTVILGIIFGLCLQPHVFCSMTTLPGVPYEKEEHGGL